MSKMVLWSAIYIFCGLLILLTGVISNKLFHNEKTKKIIPIITLFVFLYFVSVFKSISVGRDTVSYLTGYEFLGNTEWKVLRYGNFDIGYSLIAKIFSKVGLSFFLFCAFIYAIVYYYNSHYCYLC